jgi:hypothetical protein
MRAGVRSRRRAAAQQQRLDKVLHLPYPSKRRVPDPGPSAGAGAMASQTGSAGGAPSDARGSRVETGLPEEAVRARVHLGGAPIESAAKIDARLRWWLKASYSACTTMSGLVMARETLANSSVSPASVGVRVSHRGPDLD